MQGILLVLAGDCGYNNPKTRELSFPNFCPTRIIARYLYHGQQCKKIKIKIKIVLSILKGPGVASTIVSRMLQLL